MKGKTVTVTHFSDFPWYGPLHSSLKELKETWMLLHNFSVAGGYHDHCLFIFNDDSIMVPFVYLKMNFCAQSNFRHII